MNDQFDHKTPAINAPPVGAAFLLSQVGAHAAARFGERLKPLNLRPHDAGILRMLGSNPGMTQQALSETLGMFPSRLVAFIDELEGRHLIVRRGSPTDRRVYRLHLTRAGRKALTAVGKVTRDLEEDLFAALSDRETKNIRNLLTRIVEQQQMTPGVHPSYRDIRSRKTSTTRKGVPMSKTFVARIHKHPTMNATGIIVPAAIVASLGKGKKPAVKVTLNGYTYRSTVAVMGGQFMIGLSAENRKAAGLAGHEELEVRLEVDTQPRTTAVPADLKRALVKAKVLEAFEQAAPSRRKEFVRQVEDAKKAETRTRRIHKIVESLS